jgi:hypothetical protein
MSLVLWIKARLKAYNLSDLPKLWKNMPRSRPVSDSHRSISLAWINDFVSYAGEHWPNVTKLDHLSPDNYIHVEELQRDYNCITTIYI